MLDKKQNVFDDFIAAAEFLIKRVTHRNPNSRSGADRMAACWWARRSPTGLTCFKP